MKKKFLGRLLTMLLVAAMVFTLLPASAIAAAEWWGGDEYADDTATQATTTDDFYRIVHLDCGRKYFSVQNVRDLIDAMVTAGYNQLELAFGNAGLRFLLDDMSIKVSDTVSYDDKTVRDAIIEGNKNQNSSKDGSYWTEDDMTSILSYAKEKNVDIVPLLNMPGHMNAILDGEKFHQYRMSGYDKNYKRQTSKTSINLSNAEAVAFGKAFLQKYVDWFKGKVTYFNFGADEVANDIVNPFYSYNKNGYSDCVAYINACAEIIANARMTPRAFNDYIYFDNDSSTINSKIEVCYWNNQWSGSPYVSAKTIADKGHKMINTNSEWYYVVGRTSDNNLSNALSGVDSYPYNKFFVQGQNVVMDPAGAMLCIWCDTPNAATPETVISQVTELLTKFAEKNSAVFPEKKDPVDPVDPVEPSASVDITLKVGDTSQEYPHKDKHLTAEDGDSKVAAANVRYDGSTGGTETVLGDIITGSGKGVITYKTTDGVDHFLVVDSKGSLSDTTEISEATSFNYNGSRISTENGYYLYYYGSFNATYYSDWATTWSLNSNGYFYTNTNSGNRYIQYTSASSWSCSNNSNNAASFRNVKTETKPPVNDTYVSFTGVAPGKTTYHVGDTAYNITVLKASYAYPMTVTNGTTKALTPAPSVPTGCSVKYTVTKGSSLVSVSNDGTVTAANATGEATIVASVVNADNVEIAVYTYTVTVSDADLEGQSIWINYFITNHHVADENGNTSIKINAGDGGIYSDKGVAITDLISITGTDTNTGKETKLYKAVAQYGGNIQTEAGWTNKIAAGNVCMKLRYWNDTWSVCDANGTWHDVTGNTVGFDPTKQLGAGMATSNDAAGYAAITAYYAQKTKVTDEITTYATDWGEDITTSSSNSEISGLYDTYSLLDFAVKYQSGDRVPTTFTNTKTIVYNGFGQADYAYSDDDGNTRIVKDLFVENTAGYEVYMITVTKCSSQLPTYAQNLNTLPTVTYAAKNEKVVWVDKEEDLGDFDSADKQYAGYTVGGEPIVPAVYVAKQYAYLVTYYVRSVSTSQLHVCYVDQTTGKQFHEYGINVIGDTIFDSNIQLNKSNWKGNLLYGTVKNDLNKDQTVSADLSTMPEIGAQYRYVDYTCVDVIRSDDGKTVTLYYTFNAPVATFVADFGLPVTIEKNNINANLAAEGVSITKIEASGVSCGKVSTDNNTVTYTPDSRFAASEKGDTFTLTYTGRIQTSNGIQEGSVAYRVTILPASNVLYEESFLTKADGWTLDTKTSLDASTAQETQKAKETKNVFGYDNAYVANNGNNVTGELGVWKASSLSATAMTGALTTSFYGNAFDLIGSCGPTTGRVMVMFTKSGETKACKAVIVDTRFSDSTIAENLYQVPWAHVEFKEEASYNVEIYASGSKGTSSAATQSVRAYSYAANNDAFASVLASHGMSMADVEYVNAADTISTASSSIATYAAPATLQPGMHVEIDGFRVYRSSSTATAGSVADNYPANEKNVTYNNILKVVKDQITAYTENDGNKTVSVKDYEAASGPQKEIYLGEGQSVTFSVGTTQTAIQVSLRAVSDPAQWATSADGNAVTITSNTEMYYAVTSNASGSVTIANRGNTLLAIGNVKLPASVSTKSASEMDKTAVYESVCAAFATSLPVDPEPDQTVFVPEHFSIRNYATPLFRHKLVTLRIDFSKDVSYVEIDGQKYYPSKFASWFGYYTVTFTDTIGRNDNYFYKVVFFDANGNPSETQSVYGK